MHKLARIVAVVLLATTLLAPLSASALTFPFSFGGRVVTIIPCSLGLHVTIVPSGVFPVAYIWTPATLTRLFGPPRNPGQQVLGLADAPLACFVGLVPLFGFRMTVVGTSGAF